MACPAARRAQRSLDGRYWLVAYMVDVGPARFYLYDPRNRTTTFLFTTRKDLENQSLARMCSVIIQSRDGVGLVAYYTLPLGSEKVAELLA